MKGKIIIFIFIFLFSCEKTEKIKEEKIIPVTVTYPKKRDIKQTFLFTADIEGNPDIYVYPEIPGYFLNYVKNEGEKVQKDEIIAYIERKIPGMEYKLVPVKSPISGYVSELLRKKGEFVTQANAIARVARYEELFATLSLPSKYIGVIKKGEDVEIFLQDGKKINGKIYWISKTLDPSTKTLKLKIIFKNPGNVYPGMVCEVKLKVFEKKNVLSIEKDAILGDVTKYVYIKKGERALKRKVETGIENEEYCEIISGISENDTVIFKGKEILRDGMKIEIKEE
jgi:multidrug efflux pump subunit AcrA (membrane-fusion protein)